MLFPHTTSRRITLDPAGAADLTEFRQTLLRTGLESVRVARVPAAALARCQAAFQIVRRRNDQVVGFSTLHALDPAGHIRCGIYLEPQHARLGVGSEAVHLLINYAFASFDIERVVTQTTEASFAAFGLTTEDGIPEATLREHLYFRGRLWDLHGGVVLRSSWEEYIDNSLEGILPRSFHWRRPPP